MTLQCFPSLLPSSVQLKRVREAESQMKPMFEKNKRLSKKNDDLLQTLQRMEEKLKNLSRENAEMVQTYVLPLLFALSPFLSCSVQIQDIFFYFVTVLRISSKRKRDLYWPFEENRKITFCVYINWLFVFFPQKEKAASSRPPSQQQSIQPQLKRPSSLTDLSHAHEEQEVEFLKLQVSEQRGIIDELTQVRILFKPPGSDVWYVL